MSEGVPPWTDGAHICPCFGLLVFPTCPQGRKAAGREGEGDGGWCQHCRGAAPWCMVLMAETYPPRQAMCRKDVPKADKAMQVRVGSAGLRTHSHEFFWKCARTPKLRAHHPRTQPSSPGTQLGHARGCVPIYSPGRHRQGFGLEMDLATAEHPGVAQPGADSCTGAGDPPEMEDGTLPEPPRCGLPGASHSPPWAQPVLGQSLMVWVLPAPDLLFLRGVAEGMAATGQEEEEK